MANGSAARALPSRKADELTGEIADALRDKVNGAITLDDRQAYNLARDLVNGSERRLRTAGRKLSK